MRTLEIVKLPKKTLRELSHDVDVKTIKSPEMKKLIKLMFLTMKKVRGVGLAAPQIGKNINLFVVDKDLAASAHMPSVFFNSKITAFSKEEEMMEEGCLSVVDDVGMVKRALGVKISAIDDKGRAFDGELFGLPARVLQHESDHLKGVLIVDKMIKINPEK
jgi:peptide deformylase